MTEANWGWTRFDFAEGPSYMSPREVAKYLELYGRPGIATRPATDHEINQEKHRRRMERARIASLLLAYDEQDDEEVA